MAQTRQVRGVATDIFTDGNGFIAVSYHGTKVVRFSPEQVVLNSGGWQTNTTRLRMNQASNQFNLGFRVMQRNREWLVEWRDETLPFHDGMTLAR